MDTGEEANNALKREFLEETMNSEEATEEQKKEMEEKCTKLFHNGVEARKGYSFCGSDEIFLLSFVTDSANISF